MKAELYVFLSYLHKTNKGIHIMCILLFYGLRLRSLALIPIDFLLITSKIFLYEVYWYYIFAILIILAKTPAAVTEAPAPYP